MGDLVPVTKMKENSPSSIKCPMLTSTNYTVWSMRMQATLKVHKVWEVIESGVKDTEKNDMARVLLFQSIPEALILTVWNLDTEKEMWEAIKARHVGADRVREARLQSLMEDFGRMKMKDTETIDEFSGRITELSSKSASLGETIDEPKLVKKFLSSLPRKKYIHIIAALEQVLNLNDTTFEDRVGKLKAYEERIKDEEQYEDQGKLMYATMDLLIRCRIRIVRIKVLRGATAEEEDRVDVSGTKEGDVDGLITVNVIGDQEKMHPESLATGVIKPVITSTTALI